MNPWSELWWRGWTVVNPFVNHVLAWTMYGILWEARIELEGQLDTFMPCYGIIYGRFNSHVRFRVAWMDYCVKLKHGGESLTDLEVATRSLLVKWVLQVFDGRNIIYTSLLGFHFGAPSPTIWTSGTRVHDECFWGSTYCLQVPCLEKDRVSMEKD